MEMLATIVVGSIVTMILLQMLVLTVNARTQLEFESKMLNESYYIAEQLRFSIFNLEPQEIELMPSSADTIEIHIRHLYGFTTNDENVIVPDYSEASTDILILDKSDPDNQILYYNGVSLNESNMILSTGTDIELISIEPGVCDLASRECDQGIIKLTLTIQIQLNNGALLSPQTYVTTILV